MKKGEEHIIGKERRKNKKWKKKENKKYPYRKARRLKVRTI